VVEARLRELENKVADALDEVFGVDFNHNARLCALEEQSYTPAAGWLPVGLAARRTGYSECSVRLWCLAEVG